MILGHKAVRDLNFFPAGRLTKPDDFLSSECVQLSTSSLSTGRSSGLLVVLCLLLEDAGACLWLEVVEANQHSTALSYMRRWLLLSSMSEVLYSPVFSSVTDRSFYCCSLPIDRYTTQFLLAALLPFPISLVSLSTWWLLWGCCSSLIS